MIIILSRDIGELGTWGLAPGSLQLNDLSPATSSLLCCYCARADWGRSDGLVCKVVQTESCTQLERFKFSRFLLSHLFVGSKKHWSLANAFDRFPKHISQKFFFCSWSPLNSCQTDTPLSKWELCRSCACVCGCVAAPQLSSWSWDQSTETVWRISVNGAMWLAREKAE